MRSTPNFPTSSSLALVLVVLVLVKLW